MESSRKPFMFDHSFDAGAARTEEEQKAAPTYTEADMAAVQQEAYQKGLVEGRAAAAKDIHQMHVDVLHRMERLISRLADDVWKVYAQQKQTASDIAITIARKLLPDYTKKYGMQEMTAAIESSVAEMINEPRLVLRVSDSQFEYFSKEINAIAGKLGYGGKIIVLAEAELGEHDCRIEWADGGMERNINFTWSEIERQVSRHGAPVAAHTIAPTLAQEGLPSSHTTNIAV
jgi:flagellar assembly protein FliH